MSESVFDFRYWLAVRVGMRMGQCRVLYRLCRVLYRCFVGRLMVKSVGKWTASWSGGVGRW